MHEVERGMLKSKSSQPTPHFERETDLEPSSPRTLYIMKKFKMMEPKEKMVDNFVCAADCRILL